MRYDSYRRKIMKFASALAWIKRFRAPIIAIVALIAVVVSVLVSINGIVYDATACPANVTYGESLGYQAGAVYGGAKCQYAVEGSEEWLDQAPVRAGNYRVRGVASGPFGATRYGKIHEFTVLPKETDVFVTEAQVGYGNLPSVTAELAYSDKISCSRFVYGDESQPNSTVAADGDAITVTDAEGNDVTASYLLRPKISAIGFVQREITVTIQDKSQIYDGSELRFDGYELSPSTPLAAGDRLVATFDTRLTDAGETENIPKIKIIKGTNGLDVTGNYRIRIVPGKLSVDKRPLYIKTESAEKVYDGTPLTCDRYGLRSAEESSGLLAGHTISLAELGQITETGNIDNLLRFAVHEAGGRDVTDNYSVFYDFGKLAVKQRPLVVATESGAWTYDGQPHANPNYTVSAGADAESGLLPTHIHAVNAPALAIGVGTFANSTTISIFDESGKEVTGNYGISYRTGTLTVEPRPITVATASNTWFYDGNEHSHLVHSLSANSVYGLVEGHETRASEGARITDSGTADNALDVRVFDADGGEVTRHYAITYETGTLTVLPRPITVTAGSADKIYDGTPLGSEGYTATSPYGDAFVGQDAGVAELEGAQTDAGTGTNAVRRFAVFHGQRDVTFNYAVTYAPGTLTVEPRPITVTAGSAEKIYDGTPLESDAFLVSSEYGDALVLNHQCAVENVGAQTDAFTSLNAVRLFSVSDGIRDVTFNYAVTYAAGTLTVLPRPIVIETFGRSWVYDGEPHTHYEHIVSLTGEYPLVEGHYTSANEGISIVDVGTVDNVLTVHVFAQEGNRFVTFNYDITLDCGTLEITPRPITVRAESAEKVYDGNPLRSDAIVVTSEYEPAIVDGQYYYVYSEEAQTDVGTALCSVSYFSLYDGQGKIVTQNYAITYETGTLVVTPRPVRIAAGSWRTYYNGSPQSWNFAAAEPENPDNSRGLLNWHILLSETEGSRTDVGIVANVIVPGSVSIREENRDVTSNYVIEYADGIVEILPRPITVTASSAAKMYDGTPLICGEFILSSLVLGLEPLAPNQRIEVKTSGSRTDIGQSPNVVEIARVWAGVGDVTSNYAITVKSGVLTVQIPDGFLKVKTYGAEKIYDGTPLGCELYEIQNTLPATYRVEISCDGYLVDVGKAENTAVVKVTSAAGEDVTDYIRVDYDYGILSVKPRPVIFETYGNSWPYDGRLHFEPQHRVWEKSEYDLVEWQFTEPLKLTYIFDVGRKENVLELAIFAYNYVDVTENYDIEYVFGMLEITESGYTGDSGDLDTSGGIGGGGGGDTEGGSGKEDVAVKVLSEKGGYLYLRLMNFGNYNGRSWGNAASYQSWIDNKYCLNYLTGAALQMAGYGSSNIRIDVQGNDYLLPYYMAPGEYGYEIQASDVKYRGDASKIYDLKYYVYDFVRDGPVNVDLGAYRSAETAYRVFARSNYLDVPGSTLAYLNTVIAKENFHRNDPFIVEKVASYIQNAAHYKLDYDTFLDAESDIVVSFLRDYKAGVCRHYASAATLLYRALGIPARYTIGYASNAVAGEWTEFTSAKAHAWVEVYIEGMGWVEVEVTGGGSGSGGSGSGGSGSEGKPDTLTLKPVDNVKKYDGLPLYANEVVGVGNDRFLFRELLSEGYTYKAVYSGSQTEIGLSYSSIVSFALYRPDGKMETDIKFRYESGVLRVVDQVVVTIHPYSLSKYYDGQPLAYQPSDYYVTGLPSEYKLHFQLTGLEITDAGILEESRLYNLPLTITDGTGRDVTSQFHVRFDFQEFLMINRRKITVSSMSAMKIYDGTPLSCGDYWISGGSLAEGHTIFAEISASLTDIGEIKNKIDSITIKDAAGRNVTSNYKISARSGTLSIIGD